MPSNNPNAKENLKPPWKKGESGNPNGRPSKLITELDHIQAKEAYAKTKKKWEKRFPEKVMATRAVSLAVYTGEMKRISGNRHHWNYADTHRLDTIILTRKDHKLFHGYLVYDQREKLFRTQYGKLLDTRQKHISYLKETLEKKSNEKAVRL